MTRGSVPDLLERDHPIPLSRQLAAGFEAAIRDGAFESGARLPSTRDLARRLEIDRGTVASAYARLRRRRCIDSAPGRRPVVHAPPDGRPESPGGEARGEVIAAEALVHEALRRAHAAGVPRAVMMDALGAIASRPSIGMPRLFEPRPGLRTTLAAELESRLRIPIESCRRPDGRDGDARLALARREVLDRLQTGGGRAFRTARAEWIPLRLAGGTRERGVVRRAVRRGLVVLFSVSRTVRRYGRELAVREYARGVSFRAIDPRDATEALRSAAAARLILYDAGAVAFLPPTSGRFEEVRLLPESQVEALRRYLGPTSPLAPGTELEPR